MKSPPSVYRSLKLSKYRILLPVAIILIFISSPCLSSAQDKKKVDSLQAQLKISKEDTNKVNILINLCWELRNSEPDSAMQYVEQALALAGNINFKKGIAYANNNIGILYKNQGNYEKATAFYLKAAQIFEETGDKRGMANNYNNIGSVYYLQDNYEKATTFYLKALKIFEETGNKKGMANVYGNVGIIYFNQNNYEKALEFDLKSLNIYEEIGNKNGMANNYDNIGNIYYTKQDYEKALEFHHKSLKIREEFKDKKGIATAYNNIADVYHKKKDYKKALTYELKALKLQEELEDKNGMLYSLTGIGNIEIELKKPLDALAYLSKSATIAKEIGAQLELSNAYQSLGSAYSQMHNYQKAYEYYQRYSNLKDTILNADNNKAIAQMQTLYQTEKKDKEIQLLNKDNEIKEKDISKQKTIRNFFVIGFSLIMLFSFLLYNRFQLTKKLNSKLDLQNLEITKKNVQITDSIDYAQRIQHAILPPIEEVKKLFPDSFIFFKPKNIVSGDFYWFNKKNGTVLFSAVDCTGHGVPGAFMSIIGYNLLQQSVEKSLNPAFILNEMNNEIATVLRQNNNPASVKDGMDMALCSVDLNKLELQYAGAKNPLYLVREQKLHEYKADKISIGKNLEGAAAQFTNQTVPVQKGDVIYLFSDGFADQKGGADGKKFYYPPFQQLLADISELSMEEQKERLEKTMNDWKGSREQMDDMLVIGVRI